MTIFPNGPRGPGVLAAGVLVSLFGSIRAGDLRFAPDWTPGDCNRDTSVDLSDAIAALQFLFVGSDTELCHSLCDVDGSGELTISDPISILRRLFLSGEPRFVLPPRQELCDGIDNDCDGEIDEECPSPGRGSRLRLRWAPVIEDVLGRPMVPLEYRVYFGPERGEHPWMRLAGRKTTRVIDTLVPGRRYWFVVTALAPDGCESEESEEVTARAP